jgi:hypothetical protein
MFISTSQDGPHRTLTTIAKSTPQIVAIELEILRCDTQDRICHGRRDDCGRHPSPEGILVIAADASAGMGATIVAGNHRYCRQRAVD